MVFAVGNLIKVVLLIPLLLFRLLWRKMTGGGGRDTERIPVLAFFHPYCNDGGGGERVLWNLLRAAQRQYGDRLHYRLYHGDHEVSSSDILAKTRTRFGIHLPLPVEFVVLTRRRWVEASMYPSLTMMGQALGAVVLGFDALLQDVSAPQFMFDSMGFAFAYPVFSLLGSCVVLSYTHYPVISTDMLERVQSRRPSHNNSETIANSAALSWAKSSYYQLFAKAYGWVGRWSQLTMVNSSWTRNHIDAIWKCPDRTFVVYPACDTAAVRDFPLENRSNLVISIAQFRPEKDHGLQMRAFAKFIGGLQTMAAPKLVMIGAVRNAGDQAIVQGIRNLSHELGLREGQEFEIVENIPYAQLLDYFRRAKVGLHSMWNEHFGIGVVELLAAGVITIAHNSGGPRCDILNADPEGAQIGFAASTVDEYAAALSQAFSVSGIEMQARARRAMSKFSEAAFETSVNRLLPLVVSYGASQVVTKAKKKTTKQK